MARLPVGRATGAFGEDGRLRVQWLGDGPDALLEADTVWLAIDEHDAFPRRHGVRAADEGARGEVRLTLAGLRGREDAEACKGRLVLIDESALAPLGEDEFYWHELVGFDVVDDHGAPLGVVEELWETGAHDVLVVSGASGERHLIPTAREIVPVIDRGARRIVVAVIPGLLEPS